MNKPGLSAIIPLSLAILLILPFLALAQEEITITTYYPSPYGVYRILRLHPGLRPACTTGDLYYDDGTGGEPEGLYVCDMNNEWQSITAGVCPFWQVSASNPDHIHSTNPGQVHILADGTGKLSAGTIDPVFIIDGKRYATYVPDFAGGVRMETSGLVTLSLPQGNPSGNVYPRRGHRLPYEYTIDFDNLQEGSDLWLFWRTSNKKTDTLSVFLTPNFSGKVWYKKDANKLVIYGEQEGEVSYRLSAPRVDYQRWSNVPDDETSGGIDVSEYE